MPERQALTQALSRHMPPVLRWAGAVARQLRRFDVGITGKSSGSANTDALTLADLTVQELIVSALRDADPILQQCRIEAEEETGDLHRFAKEAEYTIALDPIDGTKCYRDRTGNSWAIILTLRSVETVHYSLVYAPESGPQGTWVEVHGDSVRCGPDDWNRPAAEALQAIPPQTTDGRTKSSNIYLIGFQAADRERAEAVTGTELRGFVSDDMPASVYELQARGEFAGSLIHSPNVYDFPVSLQIARVFGGNAVWVDTREPVHFGELWLDDRADMLRLPRIVACSEYPDVLDTLCDLAKDWDPVRYRD